MTAEDFVRVCVENGLALDAGQSALMREYATQLTEWNAKLNLISRKDIDQLWNRHLLHCAAILWNTQIPLNARIADLGAGGGLPGIVLKICRPDLQIVMIDSIGKKI